MADIVDPHTRSRMMSGIRGKNTKPELLIRKALHNLGYRYRLHVKDLPGKPDLVFPKYHAIILIHGCFWHGHDCSLFKFPSSNVDFWKSKIERNREVDLRTRNLLREKQWRTLEIWECALRGKKKYDLQKLITAIEKWLVSAEESAELRSEDQG